MRDADLFPSETGSYRSTSCPDRPFARVVKEMELGKRLTPRAMRRTFQDLARAADLREVVTRAVSGQPTETMQRLYSTVGSDEVRAGLTAIEALTGVRS